MYENAQYDCWMMPTVSASTQPLSHLIIFVFIFFAALGSSNTPMSLYWSS